MGQFTFPNLRKEGRLGSSSILTHPLSTNLRSTNETRQRWKRANKAKLNAIFGIQLSATLSFLTEKKKKNDGEFCNSLTEKTGFPSGSAIKNPPAMQEMQVRSLGQRKKWQLTPISLPGKPHGQRTLVGYSPWGRKELDTNEQMNMHTYTQRHSLLST